MKRRDELAELLNSTTMHHLVPESIGANIWRFVHLQAWSLAATVRSLPGPAPEAMNPSLSGAENAFCRHGHGMPLDINSSEAGRPAC